jgi:hypothetical protein
MQRHQQADAAAAGSRLRPAAAAAGQLVLPYGPPACAVFMQHTAMQSRLFQSAVPCWILFAGRHCFMQLVLSVCIGSYGGYVGDVVDDDDATWW